MRLRAQCRVVTSASAFKHCLRLRLKTFWNPKVEVHPKRSPISDDRGDKRKFTTGPSRNPAKHVPGHVPELEKTLGAVYQQ